MRLVHRIFVSNRHKSVRKGIIHFLTYLLLFAALILILELVLILFGVGDIFLPWIYKGLSSADFI